MADETATPTPETPATTTDSSTPPAVALWQVVKDAASTKGLAVRTLVIDELTNAEIIKRKDAVLSVLNQYEEKTKELKKQEKTLAKVEFDADGKVTRTYYDGEGSKALKAIRDSITSFSDALSKFFDNNDTKKLYELAKK